MTVRRRRAYVAHPVHPVTGRQFRVSGRTARQLAARLAVVDDLREALRLGARSTVDVSRQLRRLTHGPATVARAVDVYCAREELAGETRRRVRSWLRGPGAELARRELEDLDAPSCAAWLARVRRSSAPSTTSLAWRTLRALVRFAAERRMVTACPWGPWRPARSLVAGPPVRAPRECARSVAELEALCRGARQVGGLELEAKVSTAGYLGLRNGELARLTWLDVSLELCEVAIAPSKGHRRVVLAMPGSLMEVVASWCCELDARGLLARPGPVFPCGATSSPGHPRAHVSGALDARQLRAAAAAAGLPHPELWTPHSLRDSFATLEQLRAGGDLGALMARTRHASLRSLARYLRPRARSPLPELGP